MKEGFFEMWSQCSVLFLKVRREWEGEGPGPEHL